MLAYLVNFIHAFLPVSLIVGILIPLRLPLREGRWFRLVPVALCCGVLAGAALFLAARHQGALTAVRGALHAAALAALLANALLLPLRGGTPAARVTALGCALLLATEACFSFAGFVAEQALTTSSVLNTELILNIGGILAGLLLTGLLVPLIAYLSGKAGRGLLAALLLGASALCALQWGGDLLLALMRLELVELTKTRVSLVAKTGMYAKFFPYLHLILIGLLSLRYFAGRTRIGAAELAVLEMAPRRKARGLVLFELRWFRCALAMLVLAGSVLLYHDLYASRPPKISKPVNLKPDQSGTIRVKVEELADGKLHRYSHVTEDGHVVRYFMISRSEGRKIGVVYDACMMCGDMGYILEKNEVICIACNVRIFIPSIGKPGGCNPIPLAHSIENGEVRVAVSELDKGARYFSEVVTVQVKDPVTGRELVSRDAPQRYEYKGRTFFFESEQSLERFKAEPERYAGQVESRYLRVQGYQGA